VTRYDAIAARDAFDDSPPIDRRTPFLSTVWRPALTARRNFDQAPSKILSSPKCIGMLFSR